MSSPGWYPDPYDGSQLRYWDGSEWTDHRQPVEGSSSAGAAEPDLPSHGPASTSLILGVLSMVLCGFFTGVPAMVLARRAGREIDESEGRLGGRGVATAGFVTGLVGTILSGLFVLLALVLLLFGAAVQNSFEDDCGKVTSSGTLSGDC
jgi:hypothetical protein